MAALDIKSPFDDDSQTYHDGPLPRFLRMRKWYVVVGSLLILLDTGWLDYQRVAYALAINGVPKGLVLSLLTFAMIYLLAQAILLVVQLLPAYRRLIEARVRTIEFDRQIAMTARMALFINWAREFDDLAKRRRELLSETMPRNEVDEINRQSHEFGRQSAYYSEAITEELEASDSEWIWKDHDREKKRIFWTEIVLDIMRIAPTIVFAFYTVALHGSLEFVLAGAIPRHVG